MILTQGPGPRKGLISSKNLQTHPELTQCFLSNRIVKLVKNFRSHPAILEFSNNNFYNSDLQPCGDPVLTHSLLRSDIVQKKFPCVFHGIIGKDERESSSPSFFNIDEATLVKKYCLQLIEDRRLRLSEWKLKPQIFALLTRCFYFRRAR